MELLNYLVQEWAVIRQAPVTFASLAVMMFGLSYLFRRDVIRRLKEQKQLRDEDRQRRRPLEIYRCNVGTILHASEESTLCVLVDGSARWM